MGPALTRPLATLLTIGALAASSARCAKPIPERIDSLQLAGDLKRLQSFSAALSDMEAEMTRQQKTFGALERGHFTNDEHDQIEGLLFRYLTCRDSLWEIVNRYRDYREILDDPDDQTRGFIIGLSAALHLACYGSKLVATFINDDLVRAKLNEPYIRSDIPRGTYDKLFNGVTSLRNIQGLKAAWQLFSEEAANPESRLRRICDTEPAYTKVVSDANGLYANTDAQVEFILKESSLLLPDLRNRLRHSVITDIVEKLKQGAGDNLYLARGILFENVSRIRAPLSHLTVFSKNQVAEMKALLEPGDIILTFTSGYMSNIFLPGVFKHGITYVGSPEQRRAAGLTEDALAGVPAAKLEGLKNALQVRETESGREADVIEAVSEGVIFNSLEYLLETHIARLIVLRPRISREERVQELLTVFLLLNNTYDFKFDFGDNTHHCCTEVIYRALHRRGPLAFQLTRRAGVPTLSADDILNYYLSAEDTNPFGLVLLAEEAPRAKKHEAVLLTGRKAGKRFRELMTPKRPLWKRVWPWGK